jgi:transposase InsO family protein
VAYIKLGNGEFVYLAIVMDVFTRAIRGWALSHGLGVELTLSALHRALVHGNPEIHHSDQGLQYAATDYVEVLQAAKVQISMAEVRTRRTKRLCRTSHPNDQGRRSIFDRVQRL